jgi:hypothetical protein
MDHGIYYPTGADYGVYLTRRFPKGIGMPLANPTGPTEPTNPNNNPLPGNLTFRNPGLGIHGDTERWRYTVPSRRRARLISAFVEISPQVAAAAALMQFAFVRCKRIGVTPDAEIIRVTNQSTPVNDGIRKAYEGEFEMYEGDILYATTGEQDAARLSSYIVTAHLIEYDAIHRVQQSGTFGESGAVNGSGSGSGSGFILKPYTSGGGSSYVGPIAKDVIY